MNKTNLEEVNDVDYQYTIRLAEFYDLKDKFYEQAEEMGCHCPIKRCGDSACGITALEIYLVKAFRLSRSSLIDELQEKLEIEKKKYPMVFVMGKPELGEAENIRNWGAFNALCDAQSLLKEMK